MSVKKEASGRRSVQVEVEVHGTPEEVWQAIATGPGVSSWFVPTDIKEGKDGVVTSHFGPGMDSVATMTAWEPPHRFAAESQGWIPNAPPVATEWIVEARSGGTCVVRVVHSLFTSSDEWDDQLESTEFGWPAFFHILRLYLTHYRGQPCSTIQAIGFAPAPESKAWEALTGSLGLAGPTVGQRWKVSAGAPPIAGTIERIGESKDHPYEILRLDEPAPGIAILNACGMGGQVYLSVSLYLYGHGAAGAALRNDPLWRSSINEHFPAVGDANAVAEGSA